MTTAIELPVKYIQDNVGFINLEAKGSVSTNEVKATAYKCLYEGISFKIELTSRSIIIFFLNKSPNKNNLHFLALLKSTKLNLHKQIYIAENESDLIIHCFVRNAPLSYEFDLQISVDIKEEFVFDPLFEDTDLTDIEIKGKDGLGVKFHKTMLMNESPVFRTMFSNGKWQENQKNIVEMKEFSEESINNLKNYVYLRRVPKIGGLPALQELLLLSSKYMFEDFNKKCTFEILKHINDEEAIELLKFAANNNLEYLLQNIFRSNKQGKLKWILDGDF